MAESFSIAILDFDVGNKSMLSYCFFFVFFFENLSLFIIHNHITFPGEVVKSSFCACVCLPVGSISQNLSLDFYKIFCRPKEESIIGWAKKVNPKCSTHNFVKCWPIIKNLSLL